MNRNIVFFLFAILIILSSCSGYDKILKSRDYPMKYRKAMEFYEKKDHYRYTNLFEQLAPIYKGTQQADTVEFYLAQGYYYQGDYLLAGHYFDKFRSDYPRSVFTEEADFMYAYCYYKSSPRPLLDQETTNAAILAFSEFISKHPKSDRKAEVNDIMLDLRQKLVDKSYLSSKLYFDMQDYKAAIVAIKNSIQQFPESQYREDQLYMILQASYLLADNSVPEKRRERFQNTVDEYFTLIGEFPDSKYKKDAEQIYNHSIKSIGNQ